MSAIWKVAVKTALVAYSARHNTIQIERTRFLSEEQANIVRATRSQGKTPGQTISRVLQELRDEGQLFFSSAGCYSLGDRSVDVSLEDLPEDLLDDAVLKGTLLLKDVPVSESRSLARIRHGVGALRRATLSNYQTTCALCDIQEKALLVTSHINRWADQIETRGLLTNTICFCCFHDRLFENGFFSLNDDYSVVRKAHVSSECINSWLDSCTFKFRAPLIKPSPSFLKMHRSRCGFN